IAKVMDAKVDNSIFLRAFHHALAQRRATDFRKERDDIDLHRKVAQASSLRSKSKSKLEACSTLFHNLERRALPMARRRAGQQRANGMNGLAIPADNATHVALTKLYLKDGSFAARNLREHHFVGVLDELTND